MIRSRRVSALPRASGVNRGSIRPSITRRGTLSGTRSASNAGSQRSQRRVPSVVVLGAVTSGLLTAARPVAPACTPPAAGGRGWLCLGRGPPPFLRPPAGGRRPPRPVPPTRPPLVIPPPVAPAPPTELWWGGDGAAHGSVPPNSALNAHAAGFGVA